MAWQGKAGAPLETIKGHNVTKPFEPSRSDGRSDRRVIYELCCDAEPGELFSYEILIESLADGLPETPDRGRVYRAVASANKTLLRERKRYLGVIEGQGYRMLSAAEHMPAALAKKDRAQGFIRRGIELLRDARIEELTEAQRTLHEGQLMILSGIYHAVQDSAKRHDRAESLIADLVKGNQRIEERLERLEHEAA